MATMQLIPTLLADTQRVPEYIDPNFKNYKTLLAAASKMPFMDKDPAKTAGYLLSAKLSKRVLDRINARRIPADSGNIYAAVRRGGETLPLNENLDRFADELIASYDAPMAGDNRTVYFNSNGDPILLENENNQFITSTHYNNKAKLSGAELYNKALEQARFVLGLKGKGLRKAFQQKTASGGKKKKTFKEWLKELLKSDNSSADGLDQRLFQEQMQRDMMTAHNNAMLAHQTAMIGAGLM